MTDIAHNHTRDEHAVAPADEVVTSQLPVTLEAPDQLEPLAPVIAAPDKKHRGKLLTAFGAGVAATALLVTTLGSGGGEKAATEAPVATADPESDEESLPFGQSPETTAEATPTTQADTTPEAPVEPTPTTTEAPATTTSTTTPPTTAAPAETGERVVTLPDVPNPVFATGDDFEAIMNAIYKNEEHAIEEHNGDYAYYVFSADASKGAMNLRGASDLQGTYSADITATVVEVHGEFNGYWEAIIDRHYRINGEDEHGNPVSRDKTTRLRVIIRRQSLQSESHPEPVEAWRIEEAFEV